MDVAIFGGGVAGLMTAIALRAQGHGCRVYERRRQSRDAGMGFILVPEGMQCLESLGVRLSGLPLMQYRCLDTAGKVIHEEPMPGGALAVRRRDLIGSLMWALDSEEAVIFDSELDQLEFGASGMVTAARLTTGEWIEADFYVGADGVRSRARQALFPEWPIAPAQVQEITGIVRCAAGVQWAEQHLNKFHDANGGLALGVVPLDADDLVWYLQFDSERFPSPVESAAALREFVENLIGNWADPVPQILAETDFTGVHLWRPVDADLIPRFHQNNLVLVGDAAHPFLPFTSQGVSSAIIDAVTLARRIHAHRDLTEAISGYSDERRRQCDPYIANGRRLKDAFLSPLHDGNILLPLAT